MSQKTIFLETAIEIAKKAGEIMKENFVLGADKSWKKDNSPLTIADTKINDLVIRTIRKVFPNHNVNGEEGSYLKNDSKFLWVCDPVDGTIPYAHGIPVYTFSIALIESGQSKLGLIYDPILERMYWAQEKEGAFLNGKKISVSDKKDLNQGCIDIETFRECQFPLRKTFFKLDDLGAKVAKYNSIIYPSALVASGEILATIFCHNTAHDIAAVKIIVEEAGGIVTNLFGEDQRYDQKIKGSIASNGLVHQELVELISRELKN